MPSSPRLAAKRRRPRYAGLLEDNALEKLQKISSLIDLRGYLKTDEARKVSEAFTLLSAHSEQSDSFQEFLIKVRDLSGPKQGNALVVLCVVAFGKYAIRSTREIIRLSLPRTIANMKEKFSTTVLEKIGEKHSKGLKQCSPLNLTILTTTICPRSFPVGRPKTPSSRTELAFSFR
mgnify:CR=1 FL=1|jgi:hypothetical protein